MLVAVTIARIITLLDQRSGCESIREVADAAPADYRHAWSVLHRLHRAGLVEMTCTRGRRRVALTERGRRFLDVITE